MLRFYAALTGLWAVMFSAVIMLAGLIGMQWHSELLIYMVSNNTGHSHAAPDFYLSDVNRRLNIYWMRLDDIVGMAIVPHSDGTLAVYSCPERQGCDIVIWDEHGMERIPNPPATLNRDLTWSLDGRLAYWSCMVNHCTLSVWDGNMLHTLAEGDVLDGSLIISLAPPVWSSDGRLAMTPCNLEWRCDVLIWDGVTLQNLTNTPDRSEVLPAWSSNGQLAYSSCTLDQRHCDIVLWDGEHFTTISDNPVGTSVGVVWRDDGALAFTWCEDYIAQKCDVMLWRNHQVENLTNTPNAMELYPLWTPDGRLMFIQNCQRWQLWDNGVTSSISVNGSCSSYGGLWSESLLLIYSMCAFNTPEGNCDLMTWDGQRVVRLTNTSRLREFPIAWLP